MQPLPREFPPQMGHNQPPDQLLPIKARVEALLANTNAWMKIPMIATEEQAALLEDAYNQVRAEAKDNGKVDAERKAMNKPHQDAVKANNAAFEPLFTKLNAMLKVLGRLRDGWLAKVQAEQDRQRIESARALAAAQEAARKVAEKPAQTVEDIILVEEAQEAVEAAEVVATQAAQAKPQIRGEHSARAGSFRTFYSAEVTDLAAAVAHYTPQLRDAVQSLADADARRMKEALAVPGVKLKTEQRGV